EKASPRRRRSTWLLRSRFEFVRKFRIGERVPVHFFQRTIPPILDTVPKKMASYANEFLLTRATSHELKIGLPPVAVPAFRDHKKRPYRGKKPLCGQMVGRVPAEPFREAQG